MTPANLLFICTDQHARGASGCYGHPLAWTPHIDRLAARGTRFTRAYTPSPICVPARAALATGRHVHQIGHWDNAFPYAGAVPSWAHLAREQGHRVAAIGKLHFSSGGEDHGFSEEILPLHVAGPGDLAGCIRDGTQVRSKRDEVEGAGPGSSSYLRYDAEVADAAVAWLAERQRQPERRPWICFVSFVCPHPPYIAPWDAFARYSAAAVPLPPQWHPSEWPRHPALDSLRRFFGFDEPFPQEVLRRAIQAYLAACTYVDAQIGRVLSALEACGLAATTRIIYTSDHGEHGGARGLFGKYTMYEESVGIPLILAGPGVPQGRVVDTPVSLLDCFPTVLEGVGAASPEGDGHPGASLWRIARSPSRDRTLLAQYHALGSQNASFMLTDRRYKYVYHVGGPPQLFDLAEDPGERRDLAQSPAHRSLISCYERRLRRLVDPEAVDAQAKEEQRAKIAAFGGREAVLRRGVLRNSPVPDKGPAPPSPAPPAAN